MEAEEVITLFDSIWFSSWKENPYVKIQNKVTRSKLSAPQDLLLLMTMMTSSSKIIGDSLSPDSVLTNLKTVFSDRENTDDDDEDEEQEKKKKKKGGQVRGQRRNKAKSLSELEFEELKGFMDLGFVFSEEDKNSSLVDIIPGLKKSVNCKEGDEEVDSVERPYLSEAWEEELNRRKRNNALMEWRMPGFTNDMDMKSHLRKWARNVAATLR